MIARQLAAVDLIRKFPVPMLTVAVIAKRCKSFFSCRAVKTSDMVRQYQKGMGGLWREPKSCKQLQSVEGWRQVPSSLAHKRVICRYFALLGPFKPVPVSDWCASDRSVG